MFSGSLASPGSSVALNEGVSCFFKYFFCDQAGY